MLRPTLTLFLCTIVAFNFSLQAQSGLQKRADKQFELSQYKEAIESYKQVLDEEPDNAMALMNIADAYQMLNQMDEALIWYQKAIQVPNADPFALFQLGKVLKALRRYDEARQYFLLYAEAYPTFGSHYASSTDAAQAMLQENSSNYTTRNEYVNSPFSDFAPALNPAGVIFSSARVDIARTGDRRRARVEEGIDNQLFISEVDLNGFLKKPTFLQSPLQHQPNIGPVSYSGDGRWVAYTRNNFRDGTRQIAEAGIEMGIFIAQLDANGNWSDARPFPYNGTGYATGYPCFADNGNMIYFASDRPDGFGGFDLFVSTRIEDTWSTPTNLGPIINTAGHEISPFYDGSTLYFASDWHYGLGGFDCFAATFENGGWTQAKHMGTDINSSYDDYGLIYSPEVNRGYFVSNRPDGKGKEDLYHFSAKTDMIEIFVVDAVSQKAIPEAAIDFSECGEQVFNSDPNGRYAFDALSGLECEVSIRKDGYATQRFSITKEGVKGDRTFMISLEKDNERYLGRVIDPINNQAIENVRVSGVDAANNRNFEAFTNARGEYRVVMPANSSYLISYSKAGYVEMKNRINTGTGADRSLLGTIQMRPVGVSINPNTNGSPTDMNNPPASLDKGYAVQVAAFFNEEKIDLMKYQNLRSVGNVYVFKEGNAKKVRVGIFSEKTAAEAAQKIIARKGFNSTFIAAQPMDDKLQKVVIRPPGSSNNGSTNSGSTTTDSGNTASEPTPSEPQPPVTDAGTDAMVQLGAYSNTRFFKRERVQHLGMVKEFKRGNLTIFLLSGFGSLEEAKDAKDAADDAGFSGAYLVKEVNGKLIRIRN